MRLGDPLEPSHAETDATEGLKVWTAPRPRSGAAPGRGFFAPADRSALGADHEPYVLGRAAVGELSCLLHPQYVQRKVHCADCEATFGE